MRHSAPYIVALYITIISSQATVSQWLVKSIVFNCANTDAQLEYTYNDTNLIIRRDLYTGHNSDLQHSQYTTYQYDQQKQLEKISDFISINDNWIETFSYTIDHLQNIETTISTYGTDKEITKREISLSDSNVITETTTFYKTDIPYGTNITTYGNNDKIRTINTEYKTCGQSGRLCHKIIQDETGYNEKTVKLQISRNGNWYDSLTTRIFSDVHDKIINEIQYVNTDNSVLPTIKVTYRYDTHGNLESKTTQNWNDTFWENTQRIYYLYDKNDNLRQECLQYPQNRQWKTYRKITHRYDNENRKESSSVEIDFWSETTSVAYDYIALPENLSGTNLYAGKATFGYIRQHNINEKGKNRSDKITAYPNPSHNGLFFLDYDTEFYYSIYNLQGNPVITHKTSESKTIDLRGLPTGIYSALITSGNNTFTVKLITINQ